VRYPSGWLCAVCEWKVGDLPDGIVASTRLDVVYYLRAGDRIKIGTSANPRARLAQLSFDDLLAFERGNRTLEQRRHAQFAESRQRHQPPIRRRLQQHMTPNGDHWTASQ
jgi:hypothetical protein